MSYYIFFNHSFLAANTPCILPDDRGFRYGDGVFTTIAVQNTRLYQWELHESRLNEGLRALHIPKPEQPLAATAAELVQRNRLQNGLLRIAVSRGPGGRGYLPEKNLRPTLLMETFPPPAVPGGIRLWLSSYPKIPPEAVPAHIKHMQGLNPTLARLEASEHGCFEALQQNAAKQLCEASAANLFWLRGGVLHTPAPETGIYPGTTREALIRLSPYPVRQGNYPLEALKEAETVILTSVSLLAAPVEALEPLGWEWRSVALAGELTALLQHDRLALAL